MKKIWMMVLCCALVLSLCACGGNGDQQTDPVETTTAPTQTETTQATQIETESGDTTEDMVELVKSYIDQPIEDLIAVIGEPTSSDYAPSCLGEGEDGMLFYDGFIVYTYRENGVETVYDVE